MFMKCFFLNSKQVIEHDNYVVTVPKSSISIYSLRLKFLFHFKPTSKNYYLYTYPAADKVSKVNSDKVSKVNSDKVSKVYSDKVS